MKKIAIVVIMLTVVTLACIDSPIQCKENVILYEREVLALEDSTQIKGKFYLFGSGYLNEVGVIRYREALPDGGSIIRTIQETEALIYEDSQPNEALVIKRLIRCDTTHYNSCLEACGYEHSTVQSLVWYEFHVPEGTFITRYNIDLQ